MFEKYIKSPSAVCNEAPNPTSFVGVKLVISFCEGIVVFPITAGQAVLTTMSLCSKHAQALTAMQCLNGLELMPAKIF